MNSANIARVRLFGVIEADRKACPSSFWRKVRDGLRYLRIGLEVQGAERRRMGRLRKPTYRWVTRK